MISFVLGLMIFLILALLFLFGNLLLGRLLRPDRPNPTKSEIYECGEEAVGSSWVQFDMRFYVVALLFVIFDVEVVFLFPWAAVFGTSIQISKETSIEKQTRLENRLFPPIERYSPKSFAASKKFPLLQNNPVPQANVEKMEVIAPLGKELPQQIQIEEKKGPIDLPKVAQEKKEFPKNFPEMKKITLPFGKNLDDLKKMANKKSDPEERAREHREVAEGIAWMTFYEMLFFFVLLLLGFAYLWKRGDLEWVRSTAQPKLNENTNKNMLPKI